ncbi:MAG: hypothetical protein DMG13_26760 [Acidobacteria bacterium]|nr:MAG: hypothetical protein DMG13_26760 [Acidobacteriota bacterium]
MLGRLVSQVYRCLRGGAAAPIKQMQRYLRIGTAGEVRPTFSASSATLASNWTVRPHFRELRAEYEAERAAFLQGLGIELIRFENRTVHQNIQAVLETIREAIRNRTASDLPGRADFLR